MEYRQTLAVTVLLAGALGQPAAAQEIDLRLLVQMPLAVAAAADAGLADEQLAVLAGSLLAEALAPEEFIETVQLVGAYQLQERAIAVLPVEGRPPRDAGAAAAGAGMGPAVQDLLDRGLRGRELANAIHRELRARGVPAGPKRTSPLERGWLEPALRGDVPSAVGGPAPDPGRVRHGDPGPPSRKGPPPGAGPPDRGKGPPGAADPGAASRGAGKPDEPPGRGQGRGGNR